MAIQIVGAGQAELSPRTAYKIADGEPYFSTASLEKLCSAFGVPVERVIEFVPDEELGT